MPPFSSGQKRRAALHPPPTTPPHLAPLNDQTWQEEQFEKMDEIREKLADLGNPLHSSGSCQTAFCAHRPTIIRRKKIRYRLQLG